MAKGKMPPQFLRHIQQTKQGGGTPMPAKKGKPAPKKPVKT